MDTSVTLFRAGISSGKVEQGVLDGTGLGMPIAAKLESMETTE